MRGLLLAIMLTLSLTLGACAPDPLLSAPPPSRLITTIKPDIGPGDTRVNTSNGDIYFLADSGKRIVVINGLTITHVISDVGMRPTMMHTALLPSQRLVITLGTTQDTVAVIRDFTVIRQVPVDLESVRAIVGDDMRGRVYVLGTRGNARSPAPDLGFIIKFEGDKRFPEVGLGRFFPDGALMDSIHGLLYVRGTVPESAERAAAGNLSIRGEIQVWRGEERISTFRIDTTADLWSLDPATGDVYLTLYDQTLKKQVVRRYRDGITVQDVAYPLVNGATRSCPSAGSAIGLSSRDKRLYVADRCQRGILVFKDMAYEGFVPFDARDIYTMEVDQARAIAYVPDLREDKIIAVRGTNVLSTYKTGWYPAALAVNPQNGWLYVGNLQDGTVSVFGY